MQYILSWIYLHLRSFSKQIDNLCVLWCPWQKFNYHMKQKEQVFISYSQYIQYRSLKEYPLNWGLPVLDNGFVICEKFMAAIWILVFYIHRKVQYEVFIGISIKRVGFWTWMNTYFAKAKKKGINAKKRVFYFQHRRYNTHW